MAAIRLKGATGQQTNPRSNSTHNVFQQAIIPGSRVVMSLFTHRRPLALAASGSSGGLRNPSFQWVWRPRARDVAIAELAAVKAAGVASGSRTPRRQRLGRLFNAFIHRTFVGELCVGRQHDLWYRHVPLGTRENASSIAA